MTNMFMWYIYCDIQVTALRQMILQGRSSSSAVPTLSNSEEVSDEEVLDSSDEGTDGGIEDEDDEDPYAVV